MSFPQNVQNNLIKELEEYIGKQITEVENVESTYEDLYQCTDLKVNNKYNLGLRSRTKKFLDSWQQDFTIRYKVKNGHKTEIDKITEKYIQFYMYSWVKLDSNYKHHFEAMLIHINDKLIELINKYKNDGTFEQRSKPNYNEYGNSDGTWLTSITIQELIECDALICLKKIRGVRR